MWQAGAPHMTSSWTHQSHVCVDQKNLQLPIFFILLRGMIGCYELIVVNYIVYGKIARAMIVFQEISWRQAI
jgi:hypothetical protein